MAANKTYVWKDPAPLTKALTALTLLALVVLLGKAAAVLLLGEAGVYSPDAAVLVGPQRLAALADAALILVLPSAVLGLRWTARVNGNAHTFGSKMRFSPLGAAGFYFVPVVSYFLPLQAMAEIWRVSAGDRREADAPRLLALWWGGFATFSLSSTLIRIDPDGRTGPIGLVAGGIVAGAAFLSIIRRIDALQRERRLLATFQAARPQLQP